MIKIGLYGGSFKPPHYGHFSVVKQLSEKVDKIEIYISDRERQGKYAITPTQSEQIWRYYCKHLSIPVEIYVAPVSPILSIYERIENSNNSSEHFIVANTEEDLKRYKTLQEKKQIYPNAEIFLAQIQTIKEEKLSATIIRTDTTYFHSGSWIPIEVEEKDKIINLLYEQRGI